MTEIGYRRVLEEILEERHTLYIKQQFLLVTAAEMHCRRDAMIRTAGDRTTNARLLAKACPLHRRCYGYAFEM